MNHSVAVRKRAAPAIFARQTHCVAAGHQRGKRHVLTHAPIDWNVAPAHCGAVVINFFDQRMWRHRSRDGGDFFSQAFPLGHWDGRVAGVGPLFAQVGCPVDCVFAFEVGQHRVKRAFASVERGPRGFNHIVAQRVAHALRGQLVGIQLARAGVNRNFFVHQRLGHGRCVLLIVAEFSEANDVHHHVFVKFHAEI